MIITITGDLGSGKSTVGNMLSSELNYKHYSSGDFMRALAKEKGVSLIELGELAEQSDEIDKTIDDRQVKLGKEKKNFVIDARLAFHFIPNSIKIFVKVDSKIGAKRIFNAHRKDETAESFEELFEKTKQRRASEILRYKKYYNLNFLDETQYDLVIDSSNITAKEVKNKIVEFLKSYQN